MIENKSPVVHTAKKSQMMKKISDLPWWKKLGIAGGVGGVAIGLICDIFGITPKELIKELSKYLPNK